MRQIDHRTDAALLSKSRARGSRKGFKGTRFDAAAVPATVTGERSSTMPLGVCLGRRMSAKEPGARKPALRGRPAFGRGAPGAAVLPHDDSGSRYCGIHMPDPCAAIALPPLGSGAVLVSWSGGKDSCLALYEMQKAANIHIAALLTTVTRDFDRISMHGVRRVLLEQQAQSLGLPLRQILIAKGAGNDEYEQKMGETFSPTATRA